MLVIGYPDIHWIFRYEFNEAMFEFDDEFFKSELGDIALSEPPIIRFLRDHLKEGIEGVQGDDRTYAYQSISMMNRSDKNVYC